MPKMSACPSNNTVLENIPQTINMLLLELILEPILRSV